MPMRHLPLALVLPLVSPINTNPFLPDYSTNSCQNNAPAASWMSPAPTTPEACCSQYFSWNEQTCLDNSRTKKEPVTGYRYYQQPGDGLCKLDGPTRPTWISVLYDDFETCCGVSWNEVKCLASRPMEPKLNKMPSSSPVKSSTYTVIDITAYGQLSLTNVVLPHPTSPDWNTLKRVLTKSLTLTLQEDGLIHPNIEVELWTIGDHSFGHRTLSHSLTFAATFPARCDATCLSSPGSLGSDAFTSIRTRFEDRIAKNFFGTVLNREGTAAGFNFPSPPAATMVSFEYRYAVESTVTWMPSKSPVIRPSRSPSKRPSSLSPTVTGAPTGSTYYIDYENHVCKVDGRHSEFEVNFFKTLEECCRFPWVDYDRCMEFSFTGRPTLRPTNKPSRKPSNKPSSSPATNKPTVRPTSSPTHRPITPLSSPQGKVYYPDLTLLVCKSDGKHTLNTPYQFPTAEDCCDNNYMDYDKCMAYTSKYTPDPWAGFCRVADGTENSVYIYEGIEECCDSGFMGDHDTCVMGTLKQSRVTSTPTPRPTPVATSPSGRYYPDFDSGYCKSDGRHGNQPYVFNTAEKCCQNTVMEYDSCLSLSIGHFGQVSETESPTYSTSAPTPRPTARSTTKKPVNSLSGHYYPDFASGYCKSDGEHGDKPYVFTSAESCCNTANMNYDECVSLSIQSFGESARPSSKPTPSPTRKTSAKPTGKPSSPSKKPSVAPSVKPTPSGKPTLSPTVKYTAPPIISLAVDVRQTADSITDGFENGLSGTFPWGTSPDKPWTIDKTDHADGSASAKSSTISAGQQSDLYVAVLSDHGGILFLSIKADVQMPFSGFYVNVDDKSKLGYTYPIKDWLEVSVGVDPGQHVLTLRTWTPKTSTIQPSSSTGIVKVDKVSFHPNLVEDFEGGELTWDTVGFIGGTSWTFDSTESHEGDVSLRTPSLATGGSSKMVYEITAPGKGSSISFWYNADISSDKFSFNIDGKSVHDVTNESGGWKQVIKSVTPGKHKLEWEYVKLGNSQSTVWIDDIRIVPLGNK